MSNIRKRESHRPTKIRPVTSACKYLLAQADNRSEIARQMEIPPDWVSKFVNQPSLGLSGASADKILRHFGITGEDLVKLAESRTEAS